MPVLLARSHLRLLINSPPSAPLAMYPSAGVIHLAPFSDETLYHETVTKGSYFRQGELYGVDMSVLHDSAVDEVFRQPVVGLFAPNLLTSGSTSQHALDLTTVSAEVSATCRCRSYLVSADHAS